MKTINTHPELVIKEIEKAEIAEPQIRYYTATLEEARARLAEIGIPWDLINKAREKHAKKLESGEGQAEG